MTLGTFSKRVLLTGAGWSRNWGGYLATEMWAAIIGQPTVQANNQLKELLLAQPAFELALGEVRPPRFTAADRSTLEQAIADSFAGMDNEIGRIHHEIDTYGVQKFLFRFWGLNSERNDSGYLFTLNQDLFFERYLFNEHVSGAPPGALPGVQLGAGQRFFGSDVGPYTSAMTVNPMDEPATRGTLLRQMNVVKLHGSFNWRMPTGQNVMVVGTEKTAAIDNFPLLTWYRGVFREVLNAGDVRLMIMGYGFGDEHINSIIAEAVKKSGLQVFVWNSAPNLMDLVTQAKYGSEIWAAGISTATRALHEVFPGNQDVTEEYRRIERTFFG